LQRKSLSTSLIQQLDISNADMVINDPHSFAASAFAASTMASSMTQVLPRPKYVQTPIAVVGMACRLPGESNSPGALWNFLKRGGIAKNEAPESRFNLKAHHDGSKKPKVCLEPFISPGPHITKW
jgi:Beta-ketoacyl synthase, N-terminal domain